MRCGLDQVPPIAIQIFENSHRSVRFHTGLFHEADTARPHRLVVLPEITCLQEEKHASTRLVADPRGLGGRGRVGQEQRYVTGPWWCDADPSLAVRERSVLNQGETKALSVVGDGLLVVSDQKGDRSKRLGHVELSPEGEDAQLWDGGA